MRGRHARLRSRADRIHRASRRRRGERRILHVLLATGVSLLIGCGFHLRGAVDLPPGMQRVFVQAPDAYGPLAVELRRGLEAGGGELVSERERATAVLHVLEERTRRRALSVSARGRAREYELIYHVAFRVEGPTGEVRRPREAVELRRDYVFDPTDVLGKSGEEAMLARDMRRDAARLILRRVEAGMEPAP